MRARMREMGVRVWLATWLAGCAIPSAMPVASAPARKRVTFERRVTVPTFRHEARETPAQTIAARVLDDSTGLPVRVGVAAWLTERSDSTVADAWGHFDLSGVAPGRYTLVIWAEGYAPRTDVVELTPDGGASVEIRLHRTSAASVVARRALPARGSARTVIATGSGGEK